jgi:tetratricopeptide (TPR) repeat protein
MPMRPTAPSRTAVDRLGSAAVIVLGLLLAWMPFPRGLYLDNVQFLAFWNAAIALGLALWLGSAAGMRFRPTPARLGVAAVWLAYVLSLVVAVAFRQAVQEVVKVGLYAMSFLTVSELARFRGTAAGEARRGERPWSRLCGPAGLGLLLWGSAVGLALVSLIAAVGVLPFETSAGSRLFTFFGYPNSAGALVGAAFLLGVGLRAQRATGEGTSKDRLIDAGLAAGQWLLLATFLATMSRGAWLVIPGAALVLLGFWRRGRRWEAVAEFALTGLVALAALPLLPRVYGQPGPGLAVLAGGLALAVAAGWLSRRFQALSSRRQALLAGAAVLAVVLGFTALAVANAFPQVFLDRLQGFSLSERSVVERIAWTKDAFAVVRDHPLLGVGGGGWNSVYHEYQSYSYSAREVHNDFAELWLETGTVGFLAFLGFLGAVGWTLLRVHRRAKEDTAAAQALAAALAGAIAMLVAHSALDFNLALAAVGVVLWGLAGLADGLYLAATERPLAAPRKERRAAARARGRKTASDLAAWPRAVIMVVVVGLSLLSVSLFAGMATLSQAIQSFNSGDAPKSLTMATRACAFDPWSAELRLNRADIAERLFDATGDAKYLDQARAQVAVAIRLDPEQPLGHYRAGALAAKAGDLEGAVTAYEAAVKVQPFRADRYEELANAYFLLGLDRLTRGDLAGARQALEPSVAVRDRLAAQVAKQPTVMPENSRLPGLAPAVALRVGESLTLLGRWAEAREMLLLAHDAPVCEIARETAETMEYRQALSALWLALLEQREGRAATAAAYLAEARAAFSGAADQTYQKMKALLGKL